MDPIDTSSSRLTFSGLASGLDTGAVVDALMQLERRPLNLLEASKTDLQNEQTLFRNLNTMLLALRDAAAAVDNFSSGLAGPSLEEEFLSYQASSSDESAIEAEAGEGALPGSYAVRVDALAQSARRVSVAFADADASITAAGGSFTIDYGDAQQIGLTVAAGTTLTGLRDAINQDAANDGTVRADILFDGSGYRLTVSGTETGASNDVSVTTDLTGPAAEPFLDAALGQDADDARLVYLGIPVTRESNDVTDLVPGVTLRLRGTNDPAAPTETVQIDVTRDDEAIVGRLTDLVDAYNAIRDFSLQQSEVNPATESGGLLSGDSFVRGMERTLQLTLGGVYGFTDNPLSSLGQIGVAFDATGRLTLDEDALRGALDDDPLAVRELLSGDGTSDGAATALVRALEPIVRSGDGILALRDASLDDRIDDLDDQIERFELRLEKREESLLLRFSHLETLISSLQGQASFLASLSTSLPNE